MVIDKPETTATVVVNLPFFPGFYESMLSQTLDSAEERQAENDAEKEESQEYHPETYWPEKLRLDAGEYCEIQTDCMNYSAAHEAMASDYCAAFDYWCEQNLNTARGSFAFESMSSPREYNFTTDRVFVTVSLAVMESLYNSIDRAALTKEIESRHTSYDGFHSFYSNDIDDWTGRDFADFDHNEMATVLCAAMSPHIDIDSDFNWTICAPLFENDYEYVDSHCDWKKHKSKVTEARAEKLATWLSEDADAAATYLCGDTAARETLLPLALYEMDASDREAWESAMQIHATAHYRCPLTLELPL